MVVDEKKIVSRYALENDGDCISVTGPGGDRVYLKIRATGSDGRLKKLVISPEDPVGPRGPTNFIWTDVHVQKPSPFFLLQHHFLLLYLLV